MALLLFSLLLLLHQNKCWNIIGVQEVRDVFPGPDSSTVDFGAGYNAISLSRTGTYAIADPQSQHLPTTPSSRFISQRFQLRHFKRREDLLKFYMNDNSIVTAGDGLKGRSTSTFLQIVSGEGITSLDSLLVVDIDLVTDSQMIDGKVELSETAQRMMKQDERKFISMFGTHYLRCVVRGGKLILLVKIRSHSPVGKEQLDKEMAGLAGTLSLKDEAQFRTKMTKLQTLGTLDWVLYTLGGTVKPPETLSLLQAVNFALKFPSQVLQQDEVRELQYLGYWLLPSVPWSFSTTVSSYQQYTVEIMDSLTDIRGLEDEVGNLKNLRSSQLTWITRNGWKEIGEVESETKNQRKALSSQFTSANIEKFKEIGKKYDGAAEKLKKELNEILKEEKSYEMGEEVYLYNAKSAVYVGQKNYQGYASVSKTTPIVIKMVPCPYHDDDDNDGGEMEAKYRNSLVTIQSPSFPGEVLCLGKHYYTPFWRAKSSYYAKECSWRLKHASDPYKSDLEFGDTFILNNVYWPGFAFGVDATGEWALAVPDSGSSQMYGTTLWNLKKIKTDDDK